VRELGNAGPAGLGVHQPGRHARHDDAFHVHVPGDDGASVLRPRIVLARGVVVGAGAVVTRDVDVEGVVVSGVPARLMDAKASRSGVPKLSH